MHLNLGMPADAAASHRHEFSSKHNSTMSSENFGSHQTYLQPLRFLQQKISDFAEALDFGKPSENEDENSRTPGGTRSAVADSPGLDEESIGGISRRASVTTKNRTVYQLAHPVTRSHKRVLRKPAMVLQLRQVDPARRVAVPAMEVFKTRHTAATLARSLSKGSTSHRSGSKNSGLQQLVFLTRDGFDDTESMDETTEEEDSDHRDCIASLVHPNNPNHESGAVLHIGAEQWIVSPMANGGYEFSHTDRSSRVTKARWIPKPTSERRSILGAKSANSRASKENQFRFVILSSVGRKHPILGAMDCEAIEVRDEFVALDLAASTANSHSLAYLNPNNLKNQDVPKDNGSTKSAVLETTERIRQLVLITGAWVSIAEGWTQYGKLSSASSDLISLPPSLSPSKPKATSSKIDLESIRSATPASVARKTSQVLSARRHRHAPTADSTPQVDRFYHVDAARSRRNSDLSFIQMPSNHGNDLPTPVASSEHLAVSDAHYPSEHRLGLGIESSEALGVSSIGEESMAGEAAEPLVLPTSSGFHELLGRLHIGSKREAKRSSDVSGRHTREAQQRESVRTASVGQAKKKLVGAKRSRRFLGIRKSKGTT